MRKQHRALQRHRLTGPASRLLHAKAQQGSSARQRTGQTLLRMCLTRGSEERGPRTVFPEGRLAKALHETRPHHCSERELCLPARWQQPGPRKWQPQPVFQTAGVNKGTGCCLGVAAPQEEEQRGRADDHGRCLIPRLVGARRRGRPCRWEGWGGAGGPWAGEKTLLAQETLGEEKYPRN